MPHELHNVANQRFVEILVTKLRRRQIVGSRQAALETVLVLRQVISKARFSNFDQLVEMIRSVGRRLVEAQPKGSYRSKDSLVDLKILFF
jgi:translation initiation factor eIF-2B subunit beta